MRYLQYDSEFSEIQEQFCNGEIAEFGLKDAKLAALVRLACITSIQTLSFLPDVVSDALASGASVGQIKETLYQTAPYIGFARVVEALHTVNEVLLQKKCSPAEPSHALVTAQTRYSKGLSLQRKLFGKDVIDHAMQTSPEDEKHFRTCLAAHCFGDYYTRAGLELPVRELVTFTAIFCLGGCDAQARAHARANLTIGNTRQLLLETITTCLPYIGYPRTLNALACVNAVCE